MRLFVVLVLLIVCLPGMAVGQTFEISGFPRTEIRENNYNGLSFYAIKDKDNVKPTGNGAFTPDGRSHWEFAWTIDGVAQTVTYTGDSTTLNISILRDGRYRLEARKEGLAPVVKEFVIFYVYVKPFKVSLIDPENCQEIKIRVDNFEPVRYEGIFPGDRKVEYYLGREVRGNMQYRETPISLPDYSPQPLEITDAVGNPERDDRNENANYDVKIIDRFGLEWVSEKASYISVIPIAEMEEPRLLSTVKVEGVSGEAGQAPLEVEFRDKSLNAQEYEWYLFKDTADLREHPALTFTDSLLDGRVRMEKDFNYTYMNPGMYKVQLKVINTNGQNHCWDTTAPKFINVVVSLVNVPNVFTPNGDGKNDVFYAQVFSVEAFEMVILNRWGQKMFETHDPEKGWDGRVHGKYASPGTYYYIVTARGREKSNPPKYVKKGPLLLVR